MNRRDFLCGLTGVVSGFSLSSLFHYEKKLFRHKYLPRFSIVTTSHCNLNCKHCDQFAPICKEEFLNVNLMVDDFKRLKRIYKADTFSSNLTGGEPLLHPDIEKIIENIYKIFPYSDLIISTNGILLNSKDESFWKLLSKYRVKLLITKYPIEMDRARYEKIARNHEVYIKYLNMTGFKLYDLKTHKLITDKYYDENKLDPPYITYNRNTDKKRSNKLWSRQRLDLKGLQDFKDKFYNCPDRANCTYFNGKIFYCDVHAHFHSFAEYFKVDIPITSKDYICISNIVEEKELEDFFATPNSLCRFCKRCHDVCFGDGTIEWGFSERKITEWI